MYKSNMLIGLAFIFIGHSICAMEQDWDDKHIIMASLVYGTRKVESKKGWLRTKYFCSKEDCRFISGKVDVIEHHIKLHGLINIKWLKDIYHCVKCDFLTRYKGPFNRHMLSHDAVKKFSCDFCSKEFTHKDSRERHEQSQHTLEKKHSRKRLEDKRSSKKARRS